MKKDQRPGNCIKTVPIFKTLNEDELDEIILISKHMALEKGDHIHQPGDILNSLFVIHKGKIKITSYSEDGKEQVIRILSHGDFLGELALFNDSKVNTYAEAIESSVICLVDNHQLKKLMEKNSKLTFKMMDELSNRLIKAEALIQQNSLYSASSRISRLLLDLEKNGLVKLHTTKTNLALQLGITPETFSRKLKSLQEMELIEVINNKTIKILDNEGLISLITQNEN